MTKKRLFAYAAIVLAFVFACTAPALSHMIARALITYDPAEIGSASLEDEGDTVFVRMAKFTFGEGEDAEEIVAPGFTVGDAAEGDDPAANVDFDLLTPITKENRLTGALYKDVYVQNRDGEYTDLYLGELTLYGKLYGSSDANLNLLGGSLTADTIETTGVISVVSADVTLRDDLKGFRGLSLSASTEALNGDEANRPSTLTVWGSVENTLGVSDNEWMGTYNASIQVANGSTLTVTDDINVVYPVVISAVPGAAEQSGLTVKGNLSVSNGYFGLTNARAEIAGTVNVKNNITLCNGSYLSADSLTGGASFHTSKLSTFDIRGDITLTGWFDICQQEAAQTYRVYGDLTCDLVNLIGKSDTAKISFTADGKVNCTSMYAKYAVLDFNDVVNQSNGSTFTFEYVTADFADNVSTSVFDMYKSEFEIHGGLKVSRSNSMPVRCSVLTVHGDTECWMLNPLGSTVTIDGELKNSSSLIVEKSYDNNKGSTVKVSGDISATGVDVGYQSELQTNGKLTVTNNANVHDDSKLTVNDDLTGGTLSVNSRSAAQVGGDITNSTFIGVHDRNCELTVGGSVKSSNLWFFSPCTIGGDATCTSGPIIVGDKLKVGGDLNCSGFYFQVTGTDCEIGGDVLNNAGFWATYSNAYIDGVYTVYPARVKINGNLEMGRSSGSNDFVVVASVCEIDGDISSANSFGVHPSWRNINNEYTVFGGNVKVGGDVDCSTSSGSHYFVVEGSDCEIGGNVTDLNTFGVFDFHSYGSDVFVGSNVKIGGSAESSSWACVDTNSKAVLGGDLTQNNQYGGLNGDLTVGGDYINLATAGDTLNKYNAGTFVSGKLTVNGNVLMNDLVLNYNNFEQNIAVAGTITANRKTDVILLPVEEDDPAPVYVIEGEEFPEPDSDTEAYIYSVPFYRQLVELTIDGEAYAMKVNDRNTKAFVPVKVSDKYSVTYDTGETAFKAPIAPETFYYPELGLDLPPEDYLQKIPGLLFGGWYDNAAFEGDPITQIPVGAAGDKNVYLKLIVCDHAASTAQPTCTETAVCTVCGLTLATVDHAYGEVTYVWSEDLKEVTATTVCAFDETHVLSETVQTNCETTNPTCTKSGLTVYTATFSDAHFEEQVKEFPIQSLGHDTVQHEAQAPTCTEPGWAAYETCTRCDYTTFAEIPKTGHSNAEAVKENDKPATCIELGGYDMVTYCAVCGEELSREHFEYETYAEHSWGEWTVIHEPTVEEDGERERTCTVCGASESEFFSSDEPHICPLCGEIHTGFIGFFLGMWHDILFIIGRLTYIIR